MCLISFLVGALTEWEQWSTCTESCGHGQTSRRRFCTSPCGVCPINDTLVETQPCFESICCEHPHCFQANDARNIMFLINPINLFQPLMGNSTTALHFLGAVRTKCLPQHWMAKIAKEAMLSPTKNALLPVQQEMASFVKCLCQRLRRIVGTFAVSTVLLQLPQ